MTGGVLETWQSASYTTSSKQPSTTSSDTISRSIVSSTSSIISNADSSGTNAAANIHKLQSVLTAHRLLIEARKRIGRGWGWRHWARVIFILVGGQKDG